MQTITYLNPSTKKEVVLGTLGDDLIFERKVTKRNYFAKLCGYGIPVSTIEALGLIKCKGVRLITPEGTIASKLEVWEEAPKLHGKNGTLYVPPITKAFPALWQVVDIDEKPTQKKKRKGKPTKKEELDDAMKEHEEANKKLISGTAKTKIKKHQAVEVIPDVA